jgi:hypothetical protein
VTGQDWREECEDALALLPLVRRHIERETWGAMARPCPELEPVDDEALIDFGP